MEAIMSRNDVTTKIDREVLELVRDAARLKRIGVAEYLSERMREVAQRDIEEEVARRAKAKKGRQP
jgi:hypothetical protein